MEEIVLAINELTKVINEGNEWHNILVQYILPIILSIIVIVQNIIYNKQNEKIQMQISDRDIKLKFYDAILNIYNIYTQGFYKLIDLKNNIIIYNIEDSNYYVSLLTKTKDGLEFGYKMINAFKQSRLLFNKSDEKIIERLDELQQIYSEFLYKYSNMIYDGTLVKIAKNAWSKVISAYPEIQMGNRDMLLKNNVASKFFKELCTTDEVKEINELFEKYNENMYYDNFDILFEKYLNFENIGNKK